MSIKIHHGPPGSYKTSGAMGDDFLREAKEGRIVVTNVRGVTRERCLESFDELPATFDVIWIDDKTEEGRQRLATWFHWVPKGAFLFIDEAQDIFPKHWRDADIRKLDYPGGVEKAGQDDRPWGFEHAFDKHRHWNWDIVLTTPNIKKIRDDIRGVADGAYKHKDLALLGFGGRYIEGFHSPEDNGTAESHFYSINRKKVPAYVWKLYDSTATGKFTATKSGLSLLKNPKIVFLLLVLVCSVGFALRDGGSISLMPAALQPRQASGNGPGPGPAVSAPAASPGPVRVDAARQADKAGADLMPFQDGDAVIVGVSTIKGKTRYHIDLGDAYITSDDYLMAGYKMTAYGACAVKFEAGNYARIIRCGRQNVPVGGGMPAKASTDTMLADAGKGP